MNGHIPHSLEFLSYFSRGKNILIHYTCNAPSEAVLTKNGISAVGDQFGCANPREVLIIPLKLYQNEGFLEVDDRTALAINLENLMSSLQ